MRFHKFLEELCPTLLVVGWKFPESDAESENIIKKSRFIANLFPVKDPQEAELWLQQVRETHKGANHHCFAYRVESETTIPIERFSDDGEPSGTAGRPILEVMRHHNLCNALIVVTRYFGGTLLGANGLVRAYSDGAAQILRDAALLETASMVCLQVTCDYANYGKLEYALNTAGVVMQDKAFSEHVSFHIWVPADDSQTWQTQLMDWCNGQVDIAPKAPQMVGKRADGTFLPLD